MGVNTIYNFIAGRDFDFPNLRAKKGQRLPDRWQHIELVQRLRQKYGTDAVLRESINPTPEPVTDPVREFEGELKSERKKPGPKPKVTV